MTGEPITVKICGSHRGPPAESPEGFLQKHLLAHHSGFPAWQAPTLLLEHWSGAANSLGGPLLGVFDPGVQPRTAQTSPMSRPGSSHQVDVIPPGWPDRGSHPPWFGMGFSSTRLCAAGAPSAYSQRCQRFSFCRHLCVCVCVSLSPTVPVPVSLSLTVSLCLSLSPSLSLTWDTCPQKTETSAATREGLPMI